MTDRPTAEQRNEAAEQGERLRLIAVAEPFFEQVARTHDGYRIRVEWGEKGRDGFYEPTFTVDYDDSLEDDVRRATVERIWNRLLTLTDGVPEGQLDERQVFAILDAEAER